MVTAIVVIVASGIGVVLANQPALSLSGGGSVSAGGILQLHGRGFFPGGSVVLTFDQGLPVTLSGQGPTGEAVQGVDSEASSASLSHVFTVRQATQSTGSNADISISITGSFDANVLVTASLAPGAHTVHGWWGMLVEYGSTG